MVSVSPSVLCLIIFRRKFTSGWLCGDNKEARIFYTRLRTSFARFLLRIFRFSFEDFQVFFSGFVGFLFGIFRLSFEDFQAFFSGFSGFLLRIFRLSFQDFQAFFSGFPGFLFGIFKVYFQDLQDTL